MLIRRKKQASSRLDSRRRNYGDADEIEEEQREKQARKKINRNFFKFCKDVGTDLCCIFLLCF